MAFDRDAFIDIATERYGFTKDEAETAADDLEDILDNRSSELIAVESGELDKTLDQVQLEYFQSFQDWWNDTFGEESWDDRHFLDISPRQE